MEVEHGAMFHFHVCWMEGIQLSALHCHHLSSLDLDLIRQQSHSLLPFKASSGSLAAGACVALASLDPLGTSSLVDNGYGWLKINNQKKNQELGLNTRDIYSIS